MAMAISQWLAQLGLSTYETAFSDHDITPDQLPDLTDADLTNMGISSVGHRLRILNSIEKSAFIDAAETAPHKKTERRHLTVMFCDLASSTELTKKLDPEDLREVIRIFQRTAETVIRRYDGHIAQYLGDGLMVYFGYPIAHEDDAHRAAHTALELPEAIERLNVELMLKFNIKLAIRTGISSGDVVLGQIGTNQSGSVLATGATPNDAAHLQSIAKPGSNAVSESTQALIAAHFTTEKLTTNPAGSGEKKSVCLFEITGIKQAESRFLATRGLYTTQMVGRQDQLKSLLVLWKEAVLCKPTAVLIRGEAGIGKSRIVQALLQSAKSDPHHRVIYQCSPYHTNTPLYPAIQQLLFSVSQDSSEKEQRKFDNLKALLKPITNNTQDALELLCPLLGITQETSTNNEIAKLTAQEQRDKTMHILFEMLTKLSQDKPVIFILEDAHWIDATTLSLLKLVLTQLSDQRILIVLTARSEFVADTISADPIKTIDIERLATSDVKHLIQQVSQRKELPPVLLQQIVNRTDGIPLFIEELTKTLLTSEHIKEEQHGYEVVGNISDLQIPSTIQDSLMARLDGMKDIKEVARIASCVGREFLLEDISTITGVLVSPLSDAIQQLVAAEIIFPKLVTENEGYSFNHALVRDAAYSSLTKVRKLAIHNTLFTHYQKKNRHPELIALHAHEAGLIDQAIHYWSIASDQAVERAAYSEGIAHLDKAINGTRVIDDTLELRTTELNLLVKQSHASTALKGFAHPDTVAINAKARALLNRVKKSPYRFPVLYGHWVMRHAVGQHTTALVDAKEMLTEAQAENERVKTMMALRCLGSTRTMRGDFQNALTQLKDALSRHDSNTDKNLAHVYSLDPFVSIRIYSALNSACLGNGEDIHEFTHDLLNFAHSLAHPHTIIYAYSHLALIAQVARMPERKKYIELSNDFVEAHDLMAYRGHSLGIQAMMLYETGDLTGSRDTMAKSLSVISETKTFIYTPLLYANYAACLADLGSNEKALAAAQTAISMSSDQSEYWARAEIMRLNAHVKLICEYECDAAESLLIDSIDLAKQQNAWLWALRSTTSLAKLLQKMGKSRQAKDKIDRMLELFPANGHFLDDYLMAKLLQEQFSV